MAQQAPTAPSSGEKSEPAASPTSRKSEVKEQAPTAPSPGEKSEPAASPTSRKSEVKETAPGHDVEGKVIQLLRLNDDHTYSLNDEELSAFLLAEDIKDLKLVLVTVAGAFRKGKSFLLDFCLRYLKAQGAADWMGPDDVPLKGFSWKGGADRNTSGMLMWGEIFRCKTPSGEDVGVILMDTQGSFDSESTVRQCATIFALSTMTSSVLIYNLSQNLQEDDLQHLQLFTEYGRLAILEGENEETPFQKLVFLIRDWCYPYDSEYGYDGGQELLDKRLEVQPTQHRELQMLRQHISSCFSSIKCFLMPHPGLVVASSPKFDGRTKDIHEDFVTHLKVFVPSLLAPENLVIKKINGDAVTGQELLEYIRAYVKIFGSSQLPEPKSILVATAEANNLVAVAKCKDYYVAQMNTVCGGDRPYVRLDKLQAKHVEAREAAKIKFEGTRKMGGQDFCERYRVKLMTDIDERFESFKKHNERKNLLGILRTPLYLATGIAGLYSFKWVFSMLNVGVASKICSFLVAMLALAAATWGYVQYTGKHVAIGTKIQRGATVMWDTILEPLKSLRQGFNPPELLQCMQSPAQAVMNRMKAL